MVVTRRARRQGQGFRLSRGIVALSVFALLSFIAWQAGLLAPLLLDYKSVPAVITVMGFAAVQLGLGMRLARWSVR